MRGGAAASAALAAVADAAGAAAVWPADRAARARQRALAFGAHRHARHACELVELASRPWCKANRHLFPKRARARVDELLVIARLLANDRDRRAGANGRAVWDTWVSRVVPYAVSRDDA